MKKRSVIAFGLALVLGLAACGSRSSDPSNAGQSSTSNSAEQSGNSVVTNLGTASEDVRSDDEPAIAKAEESEVNKSTPIVYMTTNISPEGLMAVYEALEWTPEGNVAVKLSTGEPPASNYLRPELIVDVAVSLAWR